MDDTGDPAAAADFWLTSPEALNDEASATAAGDVSPADPGDGKCRCAWCDRLLVKSRADSRFCGVRCRQTAFRARKLFQEQQRAAQPLKFGYADPPYPGCAKRFYENEATYAGEVDHAELVTSLVATYDGWALSTSARALRDVLPLCPAAARVCCWVKPIGANVKTYGIHNTWEPLIVVPGRRLRPGKRDWLAAQPARKGGSLMGRKPVAFCTWLFTLLGMLPGDSLDDLFPGTGIVSRTWRELEKPLKRRRSPRTSSTDPRDFPLFRAQGGEEGALRTDD